MLGRLIGTAFGLAVVISGLLGTIWGVNTLRRAYAPWMWETRQCWVTDVQITTLEPWRGQVWTRGHYDVRFDLEDLETGKAFRGMPATVGEPHYFERYDVNSEVMPAAPGSLVDCWIAPDETRAYVRQVPKIILVFHVMGVGFAVVWTLAGLALLRPDLVDRLGDALEDRFPTIRGWFIAPD